MHAPAAGARRLVAQAKAAALGTIALRPKGDPYVSLVAIAADVQGRPLLLLSRLAEHTKNLEASARASVLVTDETGPNLLAGARATLLGECHRIDDAERDAVSAIYLARHPDAKQWATFGDFAFYRLEPEDVRVVEGFGKMAWVDAATYFGA